MMSSSIYPVPSRARCRFSRICSGTVARGGTLPTARHCRATADRPRHHLRTAARTGARGGAQPADRHPALRARPRTLLLDPALSRDPANGLALRQVNQVRVSVRETGQPLALAGLGERLTLHVGFRNERRSSSRRRRSSSLWTEHKTNLLRLRSWRSISRTSSAGSVTVTRSFMNHILSKIILRASLRSRPNTPSAA